ncbi:MAG: hypothetical protein JWR69_1278 [Pedosphaera sp.]|nr:hypothetical protein [Pedosphaera sp.]
MSTISNHSVNGPDIAAEPPPSRFAAAILSLRGHWGWLTSLFLIGLGAKLGLIHRFGTPLPFWDQWDGEGIDVYLPYFQQHLSWANFFEPHNEHRIVFTRLYDLALLLLNGQWDNQLQMVVNAFIHSGAIAGFGWLMARLMGKQYWPWIWLPLALALVLPFAWENTLSGFQSAFYFLLIASGVTLWGMGLHEAGSSRWRLGVYAAVAALFTVASGFLASVAVVGLTLVECLKQPRTWRRHRLTWGGCCIVTISGLLLKTDVARHHQLQAHSPGEFLAALDHNLAWPWISVAGYAVFNLMPLVLLGWMYVRAEEKSPRAERMILGIGLWVVLQAGATAYARGGGGELPGWRYMDSFCFIMITGCLSLVLLLTRYCERFWRVEFWCVGFGIWAFIGLTGLWWLNAQVWKISLPEREHYHNVQLETTRAFMATDDPHAFQDKQPLELPFPYVEQLVAGLRTPEIRGILPACVRDALPVARNETGDHAFIPNGCLLTKTDPPTERSWGSYSAQGASACGSLESAPVQPSTLPYLEIAVAGDLGEPGLSLELIELASGKATPVRLSALPGQQWLNAYVRAPAGPFKIVARDASETGWLAFKAPREMGRLSYWAMQLVDVWRYVTAAGLACLLCTMWVRFVRRPPVLALGGSARQ